MTLGAAEPLPVEGAEAGAGAPVEERARLGPVPAEQRPLTVVNAKVRLGQRIVDIWRHRELLVLLTRSELKIKYKNSVLGYLWSMLNPALVLGIYYVAFNIISGTHFPRFAIWLFAGLLAWNLFNNAAMGSTTVVVGKAGIVKKVAFPRELLALSTVGVALVLFVIQVVVLVIIMAAFGIQPAWGYLWLLPLAIVALTVFTSAVSIFLSAVNVYLRDTQHLTEVLLMAWFWLTPIVYSWAQMVNQLSTHGVAWAKWVYLSNPVTPVAMTFQRAIYGTASYVDTSKANTAHVATHLLPSYGLGAYAILLVAVLVVSVLLLLGALVVFGRLEGNFAEEL